MNKIEFPRLERGSGIDEKSHSPGPRSRRGRFASWQTAFSMIEIMVVILIIGLMASMILPRLVQRSPDAAWPAIADECNNMLYFARQEALTSQKIHRLVFNKKERSMHVEVDAGEKKPGVRDYQKVHSHYFTSSYTLPETVDFLSMKRGKKELFAENKGVAYCYVVPHGLVEDGVIRLERNEIEKTSAIHFTVQPFLGAFRWEEEE